MDKTIKAVINQCYGGFSLSPEALMWLFERGMKAVVNKAEKVEEYYGKNYLENENYIKDTERFDKYLLDGERVYLTSCFSRDKKFVFSPYSVNEDDRFDPLLIECVETLKEKANGQCAKLKIVTLTQSISIDEYDGYESSISITYTGY